MKMSENLIQRTKASIRRETKRMSPENQDFRIQLELLIQEHQLPELVAYVMKQDLKKMTDMLYYGMELQRPQTYARPALREVLVQYAQFLLKVNNLQFASALLRMLNRQQNQVLRRFAPRLGSKKDVWDHVIPTSFVVSEIICMLNAKKMDDLELILDLYFRAGQRGITKNEDARLNSLGLRDTMPPNWNWRAVEPDVFARYRAAKIDWK